MAIICPNCKTTLKEGAQICTNCGLIIDKSVSAMTLKKETLNLSSARKRDIENTIAELIEKIEVQRMIDIDSRLYIRDESKKLLLKVEPIVDSAEKQFGSFNGDYEAFIKIGNAFLSMKKFETAVKYFDKALNIKRTREALNNKGTALYHLTRHKEALKCFDEFIKIDPYSQNARHNKALTLVALGKYSEGLSYYEQAKK